MLFGDYIIPQKEELDYLLGFVKFSFFLSEAATASFSSFNYKTVCILGNGYYFFLSRIALTFSAISPIRLYR